MSKIKERRIWYFTCEKCGANHRQSHKKKKAKDAVCRNCRRNYVNPNQAKLFEEEIKAPKVDKGVQERMEWVHN
jgi:DNA replicative helicase MCM subunit Mcm2 (Cdc46/Mcm family)